MLSEIHLTILVDLPEPKSAAFHSELPEIHIPWWLIDISYMVWTVHCPSPLYCRSFFIAFPNSPKLGNQEAKLGCECYVPKSNNSHSCNAPLVHWANRLHLGNDLSQVVRKPINANP